MKEDGITSVKKIAFLFHDPFICWGNLQIADGRQTVVHESTPKEGHMKHNRIIALVASALLAVGATAFVAPRAFAQSSPAPSAQLQNSNTQQADEQNEKESAAVDSDREQSQNGDQNDPIPQAKPAITAAAVIAAAQSYLKTAEDVGELQLEEENGQLVYSVWIAGTDVKVDAMTGKVLSANTGSY
jgi:uncharacterized membrane protein YkoI